MVASALGAERRARELSEKNDALKAEARQCLVLTRVALTVAIRFDA